MKPADLILAREIQAKLVSFRRIRAMPGIATRQPLECFILQIIDSVRRIKYVTIIRDKVISPLCADARSTTFDPLKAASWHKQRGNIDEACWLVFLATQFGKNVRSNWGLVKSVYGGLTNSAYWDWNRVSADPQLFREWLQLHRQTVQAAGDFSNHRSRETLDDNCTGATISGYVAWIAYNHSHQAFFNNAQQIAGANPQDLFRHLYNNMRVPRFGRLGKFDYLSMIGKLNLALIEPDSTYVNEATGPLFGARLLFSGNRYLSPHNEETLNNWSNELALHLDLFFGMQVLEDAICNWQKSPNNYTHFVG